jgi:hypothetical protein
MLDSKKIALNALCTAGVAYVATGMLLGQYQNVNYFGTQMSAPIATGLGCGVGSIVSDLGSKYVIGKLGINDQLMNGSVLATQVGVGALASSVVLYAGGLPSSGIPSALAIGAGSKLGGDYVNQKVFNPVTGFLPIF